jgi:hypothetical protein
MPVFPLWTIMISSRVKFTYYLYFTKEIKKGMELSGLYLARVCADDVCWLKENVKFVGHKIQIL